ncbi:potassium-transporting ATPase subunit KdpC (plasmid) [Roseomonas gilardii subsp. gilardii]|uniref:potassium-transporting ATPase subunit KdpC n=1 Tax=Roseomonas gilardii TaxID=257708 RepID=UPI001FFB49B9|nr:potassium-transporting ATPase subunit KdpC [Roseomonas gilardii]UPG74535.1 potassium-transporting ATPase subunit KdpC [Roseomonas gilardii subsp. gilardii]
MSPIRPAVTVVVGFTLLLGLAMPAVMTGLATTLLPGPAGGSLIQRDGHVIGSALIGQNFTGDRYFHGRPSATTAPDPQDSSRTVDAPYNAASSAASQRGPSSQALIGAVRERVAAAGPGPVPADAVTASGSGLDPDISPENAVRQVARVAQARGMPEDQVCAILARNTTAPALGFLGAPRVNVLRLNLALDAAADHAGVVPGSGCAGPGQSVARQG